MPRNAMGDEQYRQAILTRMLALRTAGTSTQLMYIVRKVVGGKPTIKFSPFYPKAWVITVLEAEPALLQLIAPLLGRAGPAGDGPAGDGAGRAARPAGPRARFRSASTRGSAPSEA
ncbi:hypothetical protein [Nannocystis punicea]|uniref:Uncharacterized protein n=1 Tax=Nannocystis punicea TaxID=2995304 RepID=A0ABY7GYA2_9BACT|nr:hypothetical protein [Nannocystis poenicansa]WAS91942.1 hypothetical protein O0S08_37655 [Nannocystis poenicansa]